MLSPRPSSEEIIDTLLARQSAASELHRRLQSCDEPAARQQAWLQLFHTLYPKAEDSLLLSVLDTDSTPQSELALVLLINRHIDQLCGKGALLDERWAAPSGSAEEADGLTRGSWAITTIQRAARRLTAQLRVADAFRFKVWDRLDLWEELELFQLGTFVTELSKEAPEALPPPLGASDDGFGAYGGSPPASPAPAAAAATPAAAPLPPDLRPADVVRLAGLLKAAAEDGQHKLPRATVSQLLRRQMALLKPLPNIVKVSLQPGQRIVIVGDLHGQLPDLLLIFRTHGWPSDENLYCFNGDFVDRGAAGVELVLLLFAWQQCLPHAVFLNRGNHEDSAVNCTYGFLAEVCEKYDRTEYVLFNAAFNHLPLATIIDDACLVLHAGIDAQTSLEVVDAVSRDKFTSDGMREAEASIQNFLDGSGAKGKGGGEMDAYCERMGARLVAAKKGEGAPLDRQEAAAEAKRVCAPLLWSDPQEAKGSAHNGKRGAGSCFGPDVAQRFLEKHHLKLIVRSHECVAEGYAWHFKPRLVLTLFSASNYCGRNRNKGAVAIFTHGQLAAKAHPEPELVQFEATQVNAEEVDLRNLLFLQTLIAERLPRVREAMLAAASEGGEPSGGGDEVSLTVAQWAAGMTAALQLDLPWRLLQPMLAPCSLDGRIDLEAFLSNSLPTDGVDGRTAGAGGGGGAGDDGAGAEGARASAAVTHELLFSRRQVLLACLGRMHVDSEGRFSLEQLGTICRLMGAKLPAEKSLFSQPETILQLLGLTPDPAGTIEVSEFVDAFHAKAVALAAERAAPLPPFALAEDRHASPLGGGKGLSIGSGITSKLDSKPPLRRLGGMGGRRSLMSGTPAGGTGEGSLC